MGVVNSKDKKSKAPTSEEELSKLCIEKFVDALLRENPNANSPEIPDALEKRIYCALFSRLLAILKQNAESQQLSLFNHKIQIHIEPENDAA